VTTSPEPERQHGALLSLGAEGAAARASCRSDFGSPYRAGRVEQWLKIKNSAAPAVRRLEEEDWSA